MRRRKRESLRRRLVYSAKTRCECGAGFAYDRRTRVWDCSAILLGDALLAGESGAAFHSKPCAYFELVSERQPAAHGMTTRPA
jgi:hypothetical protein